MKEIIDYANRHRRSLWLIVCFAGMYAAQISLINLVGAIDSSLLDIIRDVVIFLAGIITFATGVLCALLSTKPFPVIITEIPKEPVKLSQNKHDDGHNFFDGVESGSRDPER